MSRSTRWPRLDATTWRADLLAGVTLGLVGVPQSLAYAQLAGLPPIQGLYCALLPTLVGAWFGWCHHLQTGPAAMTSLLVATALAPFATQGSSTYLALAGVLALLVGAVRLALWALRAADLTRLVSQPVLSGFTTAAALIIAGTQLPAMLGQAALLHGSGWGPELISVLGGLPQAHLPSLAMGCGSLAALLLLKRYAPRVPASLLVALGATLYAWLAGYSGLVLGTLPSGLPPFTLPTCEPALALQLLPGATLVAFIGFAEVLTVARAGSSVGRQSVDLNRELLGQGMASFAAGLSSGFPPGGSLSRSALALSCGARTAIAAMASSVVVLLVLLGGTALLAPLPRATLAALVIAAVIPLIRVRPLLQAWRIHAHDGMAGTLALVMTLALAPQMIHGFLIGVAVSIGLFLWRLTRPRVVDCGRHVDGTWRDRKRHGLEPVPGIAVLRPDARICFVGATAIEDAVYQAIVERPDLRVIVLSCDGVNELDATGCESLRAIASRLGESGITLAFAGLKGPVEEVARRAQLSGIHHSNLVFRTVDEAVATLSPKQVR